ncbi:MAG: hypothetical protein ACRC33_16945, partial [Gemmataceae bacterium]
YTESQVVNEWIRDGVAKGEMARARADLLRLIRRRLADPVPSDITEAINTQPSLALFDDWFDAASTAANLDEFVAVLRR